MEEHRADSGGGSVVVRRPVAHILHVVVVGRLDDKLARTILDYATAPRGEGKAFAFYDWEAMTGYTSEARRALFERMQRARGRYAEVHILLRSPLVTMAVNVANLALGGFIRATTERAVFEEHLSKAIA